MTRAKKIGFLIGIVVFLLGTGRYSEVLGSDIISNVDDKDSKDILENILDEDDSIWLAVGEEVLFHYDDSKEYELSNDDAAELIENDRLTHYEGYDSHILTSDLPRYFDGNTNLYPYLNLSAASNQFLLGSNNGWSLREHKSAKSLRTTLLPVNSGDIVLWTGANRMGAISEGGNGTTLRFGVIGDFGDSYNGSIRFEAIDGDPGAWDYRFRTEYANPRGGYYGGLCVPLGQSMMSITFWDNDPSQELYIKNAKFGLRGLSAGTTLLTVTDKKDPNSREQYIIYVSEDNLSGKNQKNNSSMTASLKSDARIIVTSGEQQETLEILADHFNGKKIVVLGDSISTLAGEIPEGYEPFYTYKYMDKYSISKESTWWGSFIDHVQGDYLGNFSWSSSLIGYYGETGNRHHSAQAAMANYDRLTDLDNYGIPDVILIYGGLNDLDYGITDGYAQIGSFDPEAYYVKELDTETIQFETFAQAYVTMITRIKQLYPEAEIIALLPEYSIKKCSTEISDEACEVLQEILEYYDIPYADMRQEYSGLEPKSADFIDGYTHPSNDGFQKMTKALQGALVDYYALHSEVEADEYESME